MTSTVLLNEKVAAINNAVSTKDLFGELVGNSADEILLSLKHAYNRLVKVVYPDVHIGDPTAYAIAQKAFGKLAALKDAAEKEIKLGSYGKKPDPIRITALGKNYLLEKIFASGDMCDLYVSGSEVLKIARSVDDDDLLLAEQNNLNKLITYLRQKNAFIWLQTIPQIQQSFRLLDRRRVNVQDYHHGFLSGEEIVRRLGGVDAKTIVWMFKRLYSLLEWVGHADIVHGAILPSHVLFFPDNSNKKNYDIRKHSAHLVDWCYSVHAGNRLKAWVAKDIAFYPPECLNKKPLTYQTDLFMAVKTMIFLAGGDPAANKFPNSFPASLAKHLLLCLNPDPNHRVKSRSAFYNEFERLKKVEFGPSKWHDFIVPGIEQVV